jgi:hypothetical protein
MIDVIPGGDQRPGQQDVIVPGARCVARPPATAPVPLTVADAEIACLVRAHLTAVGVMLARTSPAGGRIDAGLPPCHQRRCGSGEPMAGDPVHASSPARVSRVRQHGYRVTAPQAGNRIVDVTPAHPVTRQPGPWPPRLRREPDRTTQEITVDFASIRVITGDVLTEQALNERKQS